MQTTFRSTESIAPAPLVVRRRAPVNSQRSDTTTTLARQVNSVVISHPHLKQRRLQTRVGHGKVIIEGSVHSYFEKQMAQEALRSIKTIDLIENLIQVIS